MITNQLPYVEIDFDDDIHVLIVLASLPNNLEATRIIVSNSTWKTKFKYNNIQGLILSKEVCI